MDLACPKCRDVQLETDGQQGLMRCPKCRGTWLPRDAARLETVATLLDSNSTVRPNVGADDRTGLCPHGHGILIRARVETASPFFLERCPQCHGIWMDQGEWFELAQSHLLENLDELWDPAFRHKARQSGDAKPMLEAELASALYSRVEEMCTALEEQSPRVRAAVLAFMREQLS